MTIHKVTKPPSDKRRGVLPSDSLAVFTTYDLGVSTALWCAGFNLLSVDKENPKKALFIFQKTDNIEKVVDLYFSDRLEVKARSYFDHLKALKNKLYSA